MDGPGGPGAGVTAGASAGITVAVDCCAGCEVGPDNPMPMKRHMKPTKKERTIAIVADLSFHFSLHPLRRTIQPNPPKIRIAAMTKNTVDKEAPPLNIPGVNISQY
jgi:hypothetical protein